ncbi:HK97 family phage prohead protease [Flavobacteriaceae bacterium]|nr:HK97 family phage prohead protease [Flavobacteriaceae bacterium]
MSRESRLIHGICYTKLHSGKSQPSIVRANPDNREAYYNDDAVRLSKNDVKRFIGKPICVEHDTSHVVGKINAAFVDSVDKMRITAEIYVDDDGGKNIYQMIKNGQLSGLSVGYNPVMDGNKITREIDYKSFDEISLCNQPFFKGAQVRVAASKKVKDQKEKNLLFSITAMSESIPENTDATELMKHADETVEMNLKLAQENAEMKARMIEMDSGRERLAFLESQESERKAVYDKQREKECEDVMSLQLEQYKAEKGVDAPVPESYAAIMKETWKNQQVGPVTEIMASSIRHGHAQWKKCQLVEKELLEMRNKMNIDIEKIKASNENVKIQASIEKIRDSTENTAVAASSNTVPHLFNAPSNMENILIQESYGRDYVPQTNVVASSINPPRTHDGMRYIGGSNNMRTKSPALFNILNGSTYNNVKPQDYKCVVSSINP